MELNSNLVHFRRSEYDEFLEKWTKCRDAIKGEDTIKSKTTTYLPMLNGHSSGMEGQQAYQVYLDYAHWNGYTGRTVQGLRGLVFRKSPIKNIPEEMEVYKDNITADGKSLEAFAKDVLFEVVSTNRCGIFVDLPNSSDIEEQLTVAEMEARNIRPYVQMYKAEEIINWRTENINNIKITTLVVLEEYVETPLSDMFSYEVYPQYRVLYIDPDDNLYHQKLFTYMTDEDKKTALVEKFDVVPKVNNEALTYIPFYPVTDKGITWELSNPTVLDLVNANISHYKNSANRENALIWTGNPTPYLVGYQATQESSGTIHLGSTEAIILAAGGSAGFLEYHGQGLGPLKEIMEEKEEEMALLGGRIIAPEKKSSETAESAAIHKAGEQSVLADIANSISDALTIILNFFAEFMSLDDYVSIELNTDYMPVILDAPTIEKLSNIIGTYISWDTWIYMLQRGEILPPGVDAKEEAKRINSGVPIDSLKKDTSKDKSLNDVEAPEQEENVQEE